MKKIIFTLILCLCPVLVAVASMDNIDLENNVPYNDLVRPGNFPKISVASINCNSLNMSKVANSTRLRKFYVIASLKTDVIFLCD
jgi:hypothetical protein